MKRIIAVTAVPLLLGGCLPIPVTIASTAISGISYLQTGKFSSDHILSAAIDRDCALTRPILGESMCQDIEPNSPAAHERVVVAAYPGDRDGGNFRSARDPEISLGAMQVDSVTAQPTLVAAALPFAGPLRTPIETPGLITREDPSRSVLATRAVPVTSVPVPLARPVAFMAAAAMPAAATPARVAGTGTVSAPIDPWTPPASYGGGQRVQRAMPASVADRPGSQDDGRYVVIGSLRDTDRAAALADRFAAQNPEIRPVDVDGQVWHRVVVGPFAVAQARQVRADLGEVDGKQPWIVRLAPRGDQVAMR